MLDGLFKPRAAAVIGASNNPFSIGQIVIRNLLEYGYQGPIFPINPKATHIHSLKAYKSVLDVPDPIDLVNISVAHKLIPTVIEECGKKGVKFAIVHSAGFKEVGPEGLKREQEMVALAHQHGLRIYGPNSQGVHNSDPAVSLYANFTFCPMKPGNISIIAQSGGVGEMLNLHLHNFGLGHRMYSSYGNEADVTMPELLEYFGRDPGTKAIMLVVESFKEPRRFLEVASAITPRKPIFAMKTGRSAAGSRAVASHTGTLVDQAAMATAIFREAGCVEFKDTHQLIKAAVAASLQPLPQGKRIGLITNTGGPGIVAVDEAVDLGLELSTWSDQGKQRLQESLIPEASLNNPVDVVATANADHFYAAIDTLLKEPGVDMVQIFMVTAPFVDLDAVARRIKEATSQATKPVVMAIETLERRDLIHNLRQSGVPVFEFSEDGIRALAAGARHHELKSRPREAAPELDVKREAAAAVVERFAGQDAFLPQADAFELLAAYGIPVPRLAAVTSRDGLAAASARVGFPCALKVDAAAVVHKSEAGGVALDLRDLKALQAAFDKMHDRFAGQQPTYVVMEQRPAGREVIVGAKAAAGLGGLVLFGLGGIFVEVMKDVMVGVAPLSRPAAREMLHGIKGFAVLEGVRGQPGVDLDALEDLLLRASRLVADFPAIAEMDLNPIFAHPRGTPTVAVDVRIKIS
ncbi:MAG: acetate--CoA ligase family protein [Deltaproteobacteria bacterium]|nr:acetate--CoA ligase family protein [Deltaproteobacteria bacterium]